MGSEASVARVWRFFSSVPDIARGMVSGSQDKPEALNPTSFFAIDCGCKSAVVTATRLRFRTGLL